MKKIFLFVLFTFFWGDFHLSLAEEKKENTEKKPKTHVFKFDPEEMVLIPAGEFMMGSAEEASYLNEVPFHKVYLKAFYLDKYEVTNRAYKKFLEETDYNLPSHWNTKGFNQPLQPVIGVNWEDAVNYCKWRDKRLPTEAEWEKAARGAELRKYPWGNVESPQENEYVANYHERIGTTTSVGSYPEGKSLYGNFDMAGNVFEWVSDWYAEDYYKKSPSQNPPGPEKGDYHVRRGGSWLNDSGLIRVSARSFFMPGSRTDINGFRCAHDAE